MRLLLPLLFLLAFLTHLSAQETMIRQTFDVKTDTHIEVLALFNKPSPGGFFPVRVKIANQLRTERAVHLEFESSVNYRAGQSSSSSFDFSAPAGKTITHDILVPLCPPKAYGYYSLRVDLSGSLGSAQNQINMNVADMQPAVLLSETLYTPNASALDAHVATVFSGHYGSTGEFAAKFDPKQLPDHWLAYSGYDSILLLDTDWTQVPPGARNAISSWVRLGGQLVIYTPGSTTLAALGLPAETSLGSIFIEPIQSSHSLDPATALTRVTGGNLTKPRQASLLTDFHAHPWPLQMIFGKREFRYGVFIVVLLCFGILVGPVNLFVFAKSGMRHRLFITTPLISVGASLLLIALIILQDGFGGSGLRRVLMEVRPDAGQNAAFIHQEQFSRTGVLTASRFTLAHPANFTPVPINNSRWARYTPHSDQRASYDLQPSDTKLRASGDWFQSRSEQGHVLSSIISTRGRIERTEESNTYLSTFEFPLESLYYLDDSNQWHRAEKVKSGQRFNLTAIDPSMVEKILDVEASSFSERNRTFFTRLAKRPGHFFAITNEAPAIDTNPGIKWDKTATVITGPIFIP